MVQFMTYSKLNVIAVTCMLYSHSFALPSSAVFLLFFEARRQYDITKTHVNAILLFTRKENLSVNQFNLEQTLQNKVKF